MTSMDRMTRKRLATRERISDVATRLFIERGFDNVTIDEIADAADVGRKTVFNHFARKEDMFFDLDEQAREDLSHALKQRSPDVAPLEALRLLAHRIVAERRPYIRFRKDSIKFMETVQASPALKARARAIRDEFAAGVQAALAASVGSAQDDGDADLAAALLVATWATAFARAHASVRRGASEGDAQALFLAVIDQGSVGLRAALAGTPYA